MMLQYVQDAVHRSAAGSLLITTTEGAVTAGSNRNTPVVEDHLSGIIIRLQDRLQVILTNDLLMINGDLQDPSMASR